MKFPKKELNIPENLKYFKNEIVNLLSNSDDIKYKEISVGNNLYSLIIYIDGITDINKIELEITLPLQKMQNDELKELKATTSPESFISNHVLPDMQISTFITAKEAVQGLLNGKSVLLLNEIDTFFLLGSQKFENRSIEQPESEVSIRGPRDAFIEEIVSNTSLIRKHLPNQNLVIENGQIGSVAKKKFSLVYLKGVVDKNTLEEISFRINCITTDNIQDTGEIEQLIEDNVLSPFPQMISTERPDKTVAFLQEGKVALLLQGSPFALIMPVSLNDHFKSPEDYYNRWHVGSLIRNLRYSSAFVALFLPSIYIAMVSFHQGMIPTTLALSIAGAREGVAFPSFLEAIIMEITFEILREAGVRLPRPVGQTIGIVGGLVIGDAVVRAQIVSPIMIIVVALTALASFTLPSVSISVSFRMLRFLLMIAAATLGLYGIILGFIMISTHLVGLRSFGHYYTTPVAPILKKELGDVIFRLPLTIVKKK
ncbi:putative membrane protein YndD [Paraliobacillus quinghaiensis]|uniref:Membrane protein YndD n=1 Tax=Paraliobacillus quinghaiensis TaxID=470815 RepID=A0A917WRL8_9BACI|nr:spore germination protein [Paraliobacillus quinghaiensis]GGM23721.1 putative membrane protein YndD [Paraliobacillus quinghaiensis]